MRISGENQILSFFKKVASEMAGFPVRIVSGHNAMDDCEVICLIAGERRTLVNVSWYGAPVETLLPHAVRDLQMQVHGYNDFQCAIGMLAAEAA